MDNPALLTVLVPLASIVASVGTVAGSIWYSRRAGRGDFLGELQAEIALLRQRRADDAAEVALLQRKLADSERHRNELFWEAERLRRGGSSDPSSPPSSS